ncbi:TPA: hypothetical protein L5R05_006042 [Pseudomonas aeruginosa]|uniref:ATP-binding protein n=1 Tax=Pseudomonas aeruginosa TaxID=287 RepID=UPI00208FD8DC|nr:ATP-binding protein [Pseudomonas aeruginosa]MDS1043006.1 ATP-binding protein [Pseudomonas aeruginosa]HBP1012163.1 hypothetical protein [Pseudomonas aeruginosa]HBP1014233.1 hypothetical protein [Pseudomonas aeruginosa]HCU2072571.1 hypothetical protein [Pseudomonas aeruginosa]HEH6380694.1 hypothetical protein [Pseudomonas aeruginosa]
MDIEKITKDILAFSDPFTDSKIKNPAGKRRVELTRNARELAFDIDKTSGRISSRHRKADYQNLKSLLASPEFCDIRRLADTQHRYYSRQEHSPEIPAEITINNKKIPAENLAEKISSIDGKISLTLLDGPAGVGKTHQIKQLAKKQAANFLSDNQSPPVLHISSGGRRLSNFPDVLAATTQEIGACFNGKQVPILVRHGLIIAAIDGFDELVDADGYEDSWRALQHFLNDVGDSGQIILAARDTFIDQQELLERINKENFENIKLELGHINLVSPDSAIEYLSKSPHWKPDDINSEITRDILSEGSYALRPFFLNVLRDAGGWEKVKDEGFRSYLVNSLILREAKIISSTLKGLDAQEVIPPLHHLFSEISLEMAIRENNLIDLEHLSFIMSYVFDGVTDDASIRKLSHKSGSTSLLEITNEKDKRKFPHSEIQYYFFAHAILEALAGKSTPSVLRRTILGNEQLEVFAEVFASKEKQAKDATTYLYSELNKDLTADSLSNNGSAITLLAFSLGLLNRLDYLTVNEATFAAGSPSGVLNDFSASRIDACGADLTDVTFEKTRITTLVIDEYTKFGKSYPQIDSLEIRGPNSRIERSPEIISSELSKHSIATSEKNYSENPAIKLLEKLARRSNRYCYIREEGDDEGSFLLKDDRWPILKNILEKHNRIDIKVKKPMHGRPAPLFRIKNPMELLNHSLPETIKILDDILKNTQQY